MASPTRKPQDLRAILFNNQNGDAEKSHPKTEIDQSENAMLRSRIEEQGQLICYLKLRADENMNRTKVLEEINHELELLREQETDKLKEKKKLCELLNKRFDELAENHEEMIKYKDMYKHRCQELTSENDRLLEENKNLFSAAIIERDAQISKLEAQQLELGKEVQVLNRDKQDLQKKLEEEQSKFALKNEKLKNELNLTKKQLHKALTDIEVMKKLKADEKFKESSELSTLRSENTNLVDEIMQRGKLLQERQSEVGTLKESLNQRDSIIESIKEDFAKKEERVNANARVKKAEFERNEACAKMRELQREHEAFVKHSNQLLSQEKDLNSKLRRNMLNSTT